MSIDSLRIYKNVVRKLGPEGLEQYKKTGTLPDVKLSKEERKYISSGWFRVDDRSQIINLIEIGFKSGQ